MTPAALAEFLSRVAPHLITLGHALFDRHNGNVASAVAHLESTSAQLRAADAAIDAVAAAKFHPPSEP